MGSGAPSGAAEKPPLNGLGAVALPLTRLPGAPTAKGPAPEDTRPVGLKSRRQSLEPLLTARVQQCAGRLPNRHTFWRSCREPFQQSSCPAIQRKPVSASGRGQARFRLQLTLPLTPNRMGYMVSLVKSLDTVM